MPGNQTAFFKAFKNAGNRVIGIIGARTGDLLILEDRMRAITDELYVCTDDGSLGHHGFVTDLVSRVLADNAVQQAVAIGPVPMMKFVCKITEEYKVKTLVSLNAIMVDGTGMCGACRCSVGGKTQFACVDGPDFDGHEVDFEELMSRQRVYMDEERIADDIVFADRFDLDWAPAFFVNGRYLRGAKPFEEFAKVINAELEKKGIPIPAEAG